MTQVNWTYFWSTERNRLFVCCFMSQSKTFESYMWHKCAGGLKIVWPTFGLPCHRHLLHLGLVSSNGIAWNASRDCPLSELSIPPPPPPLTLRGQWPPLRAVATMYTLLCASLKEVNFLLAPVFHFEFRSQMNLVSSYHNILRSIQWYKLFSNQTKNKEVRILSSRGAILKWLSHAKYVQKSGPRCNKFVIRFMADLPRKYRGSVMNIVGLGSASPTMITTDPLYFRSRSAINLITNIRRVL